MAASKDTFEPHAFASNTFAAGVFRGVGVDAVVPLPTPYRPRQFGTDDTRLRSIGGSDTRHRIPASPSDSRFRMTDEDVL